MAAPSRPEQSDPERSDPAQSEPEQTGLRFGRRGLLGAGLGGLAIAGGMGLAGCTGEDEPAGPDPQDPRQRTWSPHETHQAGITSPLPAASTTIALDLVSGTTKDALRRLLTLWSHDIEALMAGTPVPGDPMPDLARPGTSLSVTVGFGPRVFSIPGLTQHKPDGLAEVAPMNHDRLRPEWSGGDLVLLISADDATTVGYAQRVLTRDAATFATVRWVQEGHWRGLDDQGRPATGRNLFGQLDGTGNVVANTAETIWTPDPPAWFTGGTTMVVRRIEMNLTTWDEVVRDRQELSMGRRLDTGAPLTGGQEHDDLNLTATNEQGTPVIGLNAHARLAHPSQNGGRTMFRRAYNYTHTEPAAKGPAKSTAGLVFISFQTSVPGVFTPIQKRLDASDALNEWTTTIGSAVFAIPGGFPRGGIIAAGLFD